MVFFNAATKELTIKIVYYGPGLSGKTTNLQHIYNTLPEGDRGRMLSLATSDDRTLFFDFLPMELGEIRGMKTRVQLYTVPGQVYYNTTRKLVLRGCDGIVFVVDSQKDLMDANKESKDNLRQNLLDQGDNLDKTPLVIQYNKRDLKNILSPEELRKKLNPEGRPDFAAIATQGEGIYETLKEAIKITLKHVSEEQGIKVSVKMKSESPEFVPAAQSQKTAESAGKPAQAKGTGEEKRESILDVASKALRQKELSAQTGEKVVNVKTSPQPLEITDEIFKEQERISQYQMGYDPEINDISLAAAAYREQLGERAADTGAKQKPAEKLGENEQQKLVEKTVQKILSEHPSAAKSLIAEEIKVELSSNEVFVDVSGIRVPIKIFIPRSMANINLRFDMQVILRDDEEE